MAGDGDWGPIFAHFQLINKSLARDNISSTFRRLHAHLVSNILFIHCAWSLVSICRIRWFGVTPNCKRIYIRPILRTFRKMDGWFQAWIFYECSEVVMSYTLTHGVYAGWRWTSVETWKCWIKIESRERIPNLTTEERFDPLSDGHRFECAECYSANGLMIQPAWNWTMVNIQHLKKYL